MLITTFFFSATINAAALPTNSVLQRENNNMASDKLVFAHFMMGIVSNRASASDYDDDMKGAKAAGIDAFALNIGTDDYNKVQMDFAYQSAAQHGMKVFISFDFHYWRPEQAGDVGRLIAQYAEHPAQLLVDGKVFASSFVGDGVDVGAIRASAGRELYFAPNFRPGITHDFSQVDAALNWMGWDSDGYNNPPRPDALLSVTDGDRNYGHLKNSRDYIAPVSPWFFTHFGGQSGHPKNWVFPSDLLWFDRWNQVLSMEARFLEILTWNDFGESHYICPLSSKHTDDGSSKWTNDMPHDGWLEMAKPFIAAWKANSRNVGDFINVDQVIYWYRPTLNSLDCDASDSIGRPRGTEHMQDSVFVVTLLKEDAEVTVTSGGVVQTLQATAGVKSFRVPAYVGKQSFSVSRNGGGVEGLAGDAAKDISGTCTGGIYNFNAFVGSLP